MSLLRKLWNRLFGFEPTADDAESLERWERDSELIEQAIAERNVHDQQMVETRRAEAIRHKEDIDNSGNGSD